jgi:NADPH-dependent curcumin reductase CurA
MSTENQQIVLATPFSGVPTVANFGVKAVPVPELTDGQVLIKTDSIAVDPYLRMAAVSPAVGAPFSNFLVGTVIATKADAFSVGDVVTGLLPLQLVVAVDAARVTKVANTENLPLSYFVGALGMPGQTAVGALEAGFKAGDVVVVTGAAGAVGSLLGQLARLRGAKKVIGVAGGPTKAALVVEKYGFDACIDYKAHTTAAELQAALKAALGDERIDYYVDGFAGPVTDAIWDLLADNGRVTVIGNMSEYNATSPVKMDAFFGKLTFPTITIRGFNVFKWAGIPANIESFYSTVPALVAEGKIKVDQTVVNGLDQFPEAFIGVFSGRNTGKAVIHV